LSAQESDYLAQEGAMSAQMIVSCVHDAIMSAQKVSLSAQEFISCVQEIVLSAQKTIS